jgi:hypothetical protein
MKEKTRLEQLKELTKQAVALGSGGRFVLIPERSPCGGWYMKRVKVK